MTLPAIVLGGGVAGLNAARELARGGFPPMVLEARYRVGGLVFGDELGGVAVDLGAESFAKRSRYTAELAAELDLPVTDPAGRSWLWSHRDGGRAFPIPHGVLGIPCSLDDPEVIGALTPAGLARAREDLTMGPDLGADCTDLASLVTTRLGAEVLDALVGPIAGGIHSADPADLSADAVCPGLRGLLASEGSLVRAAAALRAQAPQGAVVSSVVGGLFRLPLALAADIEAHGGDVVTGMVVTSIARDGEFWVVTVDNAVSPGQPHLARVPLGRPDTIRTRRLVVALDGRAALDLLRPVPELAIGDWRLSRGADLVSIDLAVANSGLDAAPRGSGLLVAPPAPGEPRRVGCKAITHYSIKWPWVRERSPHHILRVSYGRAGVETVDPSLDETLADISTLLDVEVTFSQIRGVHIVRFPDSLPPHTAEHRGRVAALSAAAADLPGLGIAGAWFAGTGLAAVLPQAAETGARLAS